MPVRFRNYLKIFVAASLVVSFCVIEADAQTRRKKRTRRTPVAKPVITNPPIAPPEATEPAQGTTVTTPAKDVKIISTADGAQEPAEATPPKKDKTLAAPEQQEMQETITTLSNQVNRLTDRLTQMQEDDRYQLDMARLTQAEQRAEQLRSQLMDIQGKIADFEVKLEQLEWALKPENIEAATAGYGSTRPEAAREARKRHLESEKSRTMAQLRLAETSRQRLEVAVANADAEVDHLQAKLKQRREQMELQPVEAPKPRKPEQNF